jgi:hypothetical protein
VDQGIISTLKGYYLGRTFAQAVRVETKEGAISRTDFFEGEGILTLCKSLKLFTTQVEKVKMRAVWKYILP